MSKICLKCNEAKSLDEFYAHPEMADGHLNKCKDCTRKDARQHRLENAERLRAYDVSRSRLPHRQKARGDYAAEYRENSPEKRAAHPAVGNAIRDGRLSKLPCAFCGTTEPVEAHHHDYSRPLDVTWLCKPCHRRFHALERMATYREDAA